MKHLVNTDDFGQSPGVNEGVITAHEHGIVTSASLMVRWPAATPAAKYARGHPRLSVGLHVDLGEWAFRQETSVRLCEVIPMEDFARIAAEALRQL
jgi:chitin disaccharide deacetylase